MDGLELAIAGSSAEVTRVFSPGSTVELELPMQTRVTSAASGIDAVRGQVALERGPFVLALEDIDLPEGIDVSNVEFDASVAPVDGVARLTVRSIAESPWPYGAAPEEHVTRELDVPLVPYYQWANRGPSTMRVWMPVAAAPTAASRG